MRKHTKIAFLQGWGKRQYTTYTFAKCDRSFKAELSTIMPLLVATLHLASFIEWFEELHQHTVKTKVCPSYQNRYENPCRLERTLQWYDTHTFRKHTIKSMLIILFVVCISYHLQYVFIPFVVCFHTIRSMLLYLF